LSIYLSDQERALVLAQRGSAPLNRIYWTLQRDVAKRAATPGLIGAATSGEWYHVTQDYIANAALAYALQPDDTVRRWLRDATMSVVHRSVDDWVGPWFRDHQTKPLAGNLETASLSMAVAAALDLAPDVFSGVEQEEIKTTLREVAIPLITCWLDRARHFNNWRNAMMYGLAAAAVVLGDHTAIERAIREYDTCIQGFQPDGSYSESLGYAGYAASSLSLTYESLVRYDPALAQRISPLAYARSVRWMAHSLLYTKPLSGWGDYDWPRFANFNDSAAIERLKPHLLPHIAARVREDLPTEAGLARWLFDRLYAANLSDNLSFLVLPLLAQAAAPISPEQAGLNLTTRYSNGDAFARDGWAGRTVLAVRTASDPLAAAGHLHGDINSMILVHNRERLLLDAGHSCYRNLLRELDVASQSHNTCTFSLDSSGDGKRPEDLLVARTMQQSTTARRSMTDGRLGAPVQRGGHHLLTTDCGAVKVIGSDAAELYGSPITSFRRFWILCGGQALFIVDSITSAQPVRTTWNWLLNNRDGELDLKVVHPDRLVVRRGDAGMKLFHLGGAAIQGPIYAYVHDDYNILPGQPYEAKAGSGILMRWHERAARQERVVVHAIALDDYGSIASWHLRQPADGQIGLESPRAESAWYLHVAHDPLRLTMRQQPIGDVYSVFQDADGRWRASGPGQ
jgi:hypothetical protein